MCRVHSPAEGNQVGPGSGDEAGQEAFRPLPVAGVDCGGRGPDHEEVGEEVELIVIGPGGLDGPGHRGEGAQSLAAGQEPLRVEAEPERLYEGVRRRAAFDGGVFDGSVPAAASSADAAATGAAGVLARQRQDHGFQDLQPLFRGTVNGFGVVRPGRGEAFGGASKHLCPLDDLCRRVAQRRHRCGPQEGSGQEPGDAVPARNRRSRMSRAAT